MDNPADPMQIVQSNQNLLGHPPHEWHRNALVVVSFHDLKKIDAQDFEDHDEVLAVGATVDEGVKQLHSMTVFDGIATLALKSILIFLELLYIFDEVLPESIPRHDIQNFDFIICRLLVVRGTLLHLQSHVGVIMSVSGKPNSRKVAPAEFLDNDVSVDHDFADMHGVVAANLVVWDPLVLAHVAVGK